MTGEPRKPLPVLALSRAAVDRAAWNRDAPDLLADPSTRVLALRGTRLPVDPDRPTRLVLRPPAGADADRLQVYLGEEADGTAVVAVVDETPEPDADGRVDDPASATLRRLGMTLDEREVGLAATAVAMAEWHAATRFCARCGEPVHPERGGWLLRCAAGHETYPATSPAVIMAVVDADDRLLLARGPRWGERNRSVLAGFVEPGESLEAAVAREVREEVGVRVQDVRYEGNQPWPFPASLMVGFTCRAASTDLVLDPEEIAAAEWYSRTDLERAAAAGEVSLPAPLSIAHHLVAQWYGGPPPGARAE